MKTRLLGSIVAASALLVAMATSSGCRTRKINTDLLLDLYNEGGVDSSQDLALSPEQIARERVVNSARRHLARGFFSQGKAPAKDNVAGWLVDQEVRAAADAFLVALAGAPRDVAQTLAQREVSEEDRVAHPSPRPPPNGESTSVTEMGRKMATTFRQSVISALLPELAGAPPPTPPAVTEPTVPPVDTGPAASGEGVCTPADADGARTVSARGRKIADVAELTGALELATLEVSHLVDERLVTLEEAREGLFAAMTQTSAYLGNRRWSRSARAPTLGMAIKGGGSSGPYSAGAAWRILTILQRYAAWWDRRQEVIAQSRALGRTMSPVPGIRGDEARFAIASGTSAGAIVAATVDLFHQDECPIDDAAAVFRTQYNVTGKTARGEACKEYARRLMATMFTCTNQATLYCVDSRPVWSLAGSQPGLMNFTGLRKLMERHVPPSVLVNSSELLLTTVDFRWGDLYLQSDQDPSTVPLAPRALAGTSVAARFQRLNIEASFVLPFIAHPVTELWVANARRKGVFLDGGIKSEIPLLALQQRGIDRAVVVGSAPTRITPTAPQESAAEIALRYLDVSLSAVTEAEWTAAIPQAAFTANKIRGACREIMRKMPPGEGQDDFCRGELARACGDKSAPRRSFERFGFFRPESVDGSFGYSFDATQMRRLFEAGAESVRQRCDELAAFLGIQGPTNAELSTWCNETPIAEQNLCDMRATETERCTE